MKLQLEDTTSSKRKLLIVDCSGSMYYALPQLKEILKNNLHLLAASGCELSIIWFSGKNESGYVVENLKLNNAVDFETCKKGIDAYLKTVGLTSFVDPLKEATKFQDATITFITDGNDNSNKREDILNLCKQLPNMRILEFGYYCDSEFLQKMIQSTQDSGESLYSDDISDLGDQLVDSLTSSMAELQVNTADGEQWFLVTDQSVIGYTKNKVRVPQNAEHAYFKSDRLQYDLCRLYCSSVFEEQEELVNIINDRILTKLFNNILNTTSLNRFKAHVFDLITKVLLIQHPIGQEKPQHSVLELLEYVSAERILVDYSAITFKKITAGKKSDRLPVTVLNNHLPIDITFNMDSPNISMRFHRDILVDVSSKTNLLKMVASNDYKTITVVADGNLLVKEIPLVNLTTEQREYLSEYLVNDTLVLSNLDLMNVVYDGNIIDKIAYLSRILLSTQAEYKVINHFSNLERTENRTKKMSEIYNDEMLEVLKELGLTDAGYNPKSTVEHNGDVRMVTECTVKIKSFSSLPSLNAVLTKQASGKTMTPSEALIYEYYNRYVGEPIPMSTYHIVNDNRISIIKAIAELKLMLLLSPRYRKERMMLIEKGYEKDNLSISIREVEVKL